jgi:hypothetical protein
VTAGERGRACLLAGTLAAMALSPAAGQEAARPGESPFALAWEESLGLASETGRPGAFIVKELLAFTAGPFSGTADISTALGIEGGTESFLVDSTGLHFGCRVLEPRFPGIFLDSQLRYRKLFEGAWELRYGGILWGRWGEGNEARGLFGDWAVGFEGIRTAIDGFPSAFTEGNPMARLALGWRFSPDAASALAMESFSDDVASYFPKILFDLGSSLALPKLTLQLHLILLYTDFFTPTGYVDGYSMRLSATLPLKGA